MKSNFSLTASLRADVGKGASRRLRYADQIPAIVYGGGKDSMSISLDHTQISRALENESFYSSILSIVLDGQTQNVVLKDLQRHPFKPRIMHADFQRVSATEKLTMNVPLHFLGGDVAPGVKLSGGVISHLFSEVAVRCLPADLPEYIEIDLSKLELNQNILLSALVLPKGIELVDLIHGDDRPVVTLHMPRAVVEEAVAAPVAAAGEAVAGGEEKKAESTSEKKE